MADLKNLTTAREKFLEQLKKDKRSHSTILAYGADLEQFIAFSHEKQITQGSSVTSELIEAFKKSLVENKYTLKSVSRKLNSIKSYFRFLAREKIIEEDPANTIAHPKYEVEPPRVLSKMEYRALRDAARDDPRMAGIIELLLQTGIRIGELARLESEDFNSNKLHIRAYESQPERTVTLNQPAIKALNRYLDIRPKTKVPQIFITKTNNPLLVRNIRSAINRYFRLAGIKNAAVNDLRHTFIAHQLSAGASVVLIQKLVGHKRLSTTEKYLSLIQSKSDENAKLEEL